MGCPFLKETCSWTILTKKVTINHEPYECDYYLLVTIIVGTVASIKVKMINLYEKLRWNECY
jgi:hypothetical protein